MENNKKITVFKNFADTDSPVHIEFEKVIERIKNPNDSLVSKIESLRNTKDKNESVKIKKTLPCILFSGEFTKRLDSAIEKHSGLAVVDFDHVDDVNVLKDKLKLIPYVASAFVSPSGDGVKVVVRIPDVIEEHRNNYDQVIDDLKRRLDYLPDSCFDKSSINESRICYASYDKDAYLNLSARVFEPKQKKQDVSFTDYRKINIAVNMIRLAPEGMRHATVIKAAKLIGGYIASGVVEESIAIQILMNEVEQKFAGEDTKIEIRAIEDGIAYGKSQPLYETEELENDAVIEELKVQLRNPSRKYEFLSDLSEDSHDLDRYRKDGFKEGDYTGHTELDKHFRFKEGDFNVVLGHANVGKSFFMWWLMVLSAVRLDWRWIVYTTENKVRQVKKKLIEFYLQQKITDATETDYQSAKKWLDQMFTFIRIDKMYSATELLNFAEILLKEGNYKGFLIDPYNSLSIDKQIWSDVKGNRHEYDYTVASMFVKFCDKHNISIYLNAHAVTEALRKKHTKGGRNEEPHVYAGQPMPPEAADIEGGGKFVNRVTGFFIVIHRYIYDHRDWMITKVEIKKVKDTETGGMQTRYERPIDFCMMDDMTWFSEVGRNYNPIPYNNPNQQTEIDIFDVNPEDAF